MVGKLHRVPLREVWKHEAHDFTKWLCDNLAVINELTGLALVSAENEQSAGDFKIDLVAEDESGNTVVIENQLERSDHDHLGKLITYVSAMNAAAAIWVVAQPRPEHSTAIAWLNQGGGAAFYLIQAEAVRIDDSPPAPLLTTIVRPSDEGLLIGQAKKEKGERHLLRRRFWTGLLELAKTKTKLHSTVSPNDYGWVGTSAGRAGLNYNYAIRQHDGDVELYIDRGKESDEANVKVLKALAEHREQIDASFGEPLDWQELEGRRACRIAKRITAGGYRDDESKWPAIHEAMIDAMVRLNAALQPYIAKLPS